MSCARDSTFASIWDNALESLRTVLEAQSLRPRDVPANLDIELAREAVNRAQHYIEDRAAMVADVCNGLRILTQAAPVFIVIDEFDRSASDEVRVPLADLVKMLSDEGIPVTVVVVGVADDVVGLMGEHPSIVRSMKQIHMPRMETRELEDIVVRGLQAADMGVSSEARNRIVRLSYGLPHYAHLLGQLSGFAALGFGEDFVDVHHVEPAIESAIEQAHGTVIHDYTDAVASTHRDAQYRHVLLACALAKRNDLGEFSAPDVRKPLSAILGRAVDIPHYARHLKEFCERGVLQKRGRARGYRYRFRDPLLQPYVVMRGVREGMMPSGFGWGS
jgi:hypothetical protein